MNEDLIQIKKCKNILILKEEEKKENFIKFKIDKLENIFFKTNKTPKAIIIKPTNLVNIFSSSKLANFETKNAPIISRLLQASHDKPEKRCADCNESHQAICSLKS